MSAPQIGDVTRIEGKLHHYHGAADGWVPFPGAPDIEAAPPRDNSLSELIKHYDKGGLIILLGVPALSLLMVVIGHLLDWRAG